MSGTIVTAKDIIEILKTAKTSRVTKLKLGDLEVEFDTNFHPNKTKNNTVHKDVIGTDGVELAITPSLSLQNDQKEVDDNELLFDELLDQINIENPAEHEEMQIKMLNRGKQFVRE